MMRVGIAADHGGFGLKALLSEALRADEYAVADFGAHELNPNDDYPDFVIPLAKAVAAREVERGIALRGSGVGACIAANKIPGVRAGLIHDVFSAHQGVEDYEMNVFCLGGKVIGSALALELIERFLCAVQPCTTPQATYCKSPGVGGARFRVRSTLSVRDRRRTVRNLNEAIISPGPKNEARCPC